MAKRQPKTDPTACPGSGWRSMKDAAEFMGISLNAFNRYYRDKLDPGDIKEIPRGKTVSVWVYGPGVLKTRDKVKGLTVGGDEDLLAGDSPALERYREEKALLARMDRLEREGELTKVSELAPHLHRIANQIRVVCESILKSKDKTKGRATMDDAFAEIKQSITDLEAASFTK